MWRPLLLKTEAPGWIFPQQSGAWAVDRAAPACWILLTVHSLTPECLLTSGCGTNIYKVLCGEKNSKLFFIFWNIWNLVTVFWFFPHFKQFSHFGILIMTSDDVWLFCIDCVVQSIAVRKVWMCSNQRAIYPCSSSITFNIILMSLCGECC